MLGAVSNIADLTGCAKMFPPFSEGTVQNGYHPLTNC